MNTVIYSRKSLKQLKRIPLPQRRQIVDKSESLGNMPGVPNVKPLINHLYGYRLRVGRYRVFFNFDGDIKIVEIMEVKKRDERTY